MVIFRTGYYWCHANFNWTKLQKRNFMTTGTAGMLRWSKFNCLCRCISSHAKCCEFRQLTRLDTCVKYLNVIFGNLKLILRKRLDIIISIIFLVKLHLLKILQTLTIQCFELSWCNYIDTYTWSLERFLRLNVNTWFK